MLKTGQLKSSASRVYFIIFLAGVLILSALPAFFYMSKATKNPAEFKTQEKHYATVEIRVSDISPEVLSLVKVGDIQKDHNGEENVKIISILKVTPMLAGKVSVDGVKYLDVVTDKKELYALLRIRYEEVGDKVVIHPTTTMLKVGNKLAFEFENYYLNAEILKVDKGV